MVLEELTLPIVLAAAAIDSINPCAIGVIIFFITALLINKNERHKLVIFGIVYIAMVFLTYFLAGLGLIWFQSFLVQAGDSFLLGTVVGILVILAGLVEIKDYFWYGYGFSLGIPVWASKKIEEMAQKATLPIAFILGIFVALVELPCTGGPYFAITAILARQFDWTAVQYLFIYNIIFVLPLILILAAALFGISPEKMEHLRHEKRGVMRLGIGLLLLFLGYFIMLYYGGFLTF